MKIHTDFEQNSLQWLAARAGVVTASEFHNLLTPKWKIRTGDGVDTYLSRKVAEKWIGGPLPGFSTIDMDLGHILEEEARPWFEWEHGVKVETVAFITSDDGRIGCSPDGLIGDDGGLELKCPQPHTHVGYLLDGVVPDIYLAQVHGSMFVTGRPWWKFVSYCRGFPALVLHVERDEEIQAAIRMAVEMFLERMDEALGRMEALNGGPPRRTVAPVAEAQTVPFDLIP